MPGYMDSAQARIGPSGHIDCLALRAPGRRRRRFGFSFSWPMPLVAIMTYALTFVESSSHLVDLLLNEDIVRQRFARRDRCWSLPCKRLSARCGPCRSGIASCRGRTVVYQTDNRRKTGTCVRVRNKTATSHLFPRCLIAPAPFELRRRDALAQ